MLYLLRAKINNILYFVGIK